MANYNVGNIEIGVTSNSTKAVSSLDKVISKLKEFKSIDKNLQNIFLRVNQLSNGLKNLANIDVGKVSNKIENVAEATKKMVDGLVSIEKPNFDETATSLNKLGNAFRQFDQIKNFDFRGMYNSFNSLNRILDPFLNKLKSSEASLRDMAMILNNLKARTISKATQELEKADKSAKKLSNSTKDINQNLNKTGQMSNILSKVFNVGKIYFLYNYTQRFVRLLASTITTASDYTEILNKFEVSFGSLAKENIKYVNKLADTFGFSTNTLLDYTATFNNMLKGLKGLSNEMSAEISKTLTSMAIDYSSLFNVGIEQAMTAFQSAISGNVRTIRETSGFDVSETTIFSIYQSLGGTKSMRQLNQLEKRLLRIIAIEQQLQETGATGDYARTIETVSNQVKILKEQFVEMTKWIGMNLLVYAKPLIQYANAIVLTIKELAKGLASVKQQQDKIDYETEFAGFKGAVDDTNSAVEDLTKSLSLLSLDQLNILGSSSTSTSLDGLSVEGNILNGLKQYRQNLDKISFKAKEISDTFLTWLGYTKQYNAETESWEWKIDSVSDRLKTIFNIVKSVIGLVIGSKIGGMISSLVQGFIAMKGAIAGVSASVLTISSVVGVIAGVIVYLAVVNKEFRQNLQTFFTTLGKGILPIIKTIKTIFNWLTSVLGQIMNAIMPILTEDAKVISDVISFIMDIIDLITDNLIQILQPIMDVIVDVIREIAEVVKMFEPIFKPILDIVGKIAGTLLNEIFGILKEVASFITDVLVGAVNLFKGSLAVVVGVIKTITNTFDAIKQTFELLVDVLTNKKPFSSFADGIKNIWGELGENLKKIWSNVWDSIKGVFLSIINGIIKMFAKFVNSLSNQINNLTSLLSNIWTWTGAPAIPEIPTWNPEPLKFAKGGVITKPTNALMGEYANAQTNPEIVAPQSIMKETFLEAITPLVNAILQGDKNVISAIKDSGNNQVYLNGRKVSEAIFDDLGNVATRKGKILFANK